MNGFLDPDYSDGWDDGFDDREHGRTFRLKSSGSSRYDAGYVAGYDAAGEQK